MPIRSDSGLNRNELLIHNDNRSNRLLYTEWAHNIWKPMLACYSSFKMAMLLMEITNNYSKHIFLTKLIIRSSSSTTNESCSNRNPFKSGE